MANAMVSRVSHVFSFCHQWFGWEKKEDIERVIVLLLLHTYDLLFVSICQRFSVCVLKTWIGYAIFFSAITRSLAMCYEMGEMCIYTQTVGKHYKFIRINCWTPAFTIGTGTREQVRMAANTTAFPPFIFLTRANAERASISIAWSFEWKNCSVHGPTYGEKWKKVKERAKLSGANATFPSYNYVGCACCSSLNVVHRRYRSRCVGFDRNLCGRLYAHALLAANRCHCLHLLMSHSFFCTEIWIVPMSNL